MNLGNAVEFLCNKTILVTGATGFLGKVLVEKILRVQPNVKKLYLLIRAKDNKSALERLHDEILREELFRLLRETQSAEFDSFIVEKLAPVDGDTSLINLGLNDNSYINKEIDVIIHGAARTRFQERYDSALGINTLGAKNILQFAKTCPKLQILVHVSTAYVSKQKAGLIPEAISGIAGLDIDEEKKLVDQKLDHLTSKGVSTIKIRDSMRRFGQKRAKLHGWPNTYTFTKAMAEMLICEHKGELPVVIVRPTMICSTFKDPFPGWIQDKGSMAILSVVYGKGLVYFTHADGNTILDMIPVDMVVNSTIMSMVANANKPCLTIYQVGSSLRNPLTLSKLVATNFQYFIKNPWISEGMPVKVKRSKLVKCRLHFLMLMLQHISKLMMLKLVDTTFCHRIKVNQDKLEMELKVTAQMAMTFRHYLIFHGIFDDKNTEKLRITMAKANNVEKEIFNFDPKCIDWEDYLLNNYIPAIVRYSF
ncbi:alcohol-forming fatty acyl-CoA reductase isoform X1 [Beta vulgaris subsp. vulgaris]|uniref:alcohol-forming fatty acyl-CoA reductase isoform X1 n=1 Tax=Beta vulgaris subsp. vulgaris TaxID=3555 RepID=UPI002036B8CB|nr:alcohol-forming fatty acyl-CoA reductase isoform X1 [Beta vulgaris subsp. vulgaris]